MTQRKTESAAREGAGFEREAILPTDQRTQEILFRLSRQDSVAGKLAKRLWDALHERLQIWADEGRQPKEFELPPNLVKGIKKEEWNALQYEMEDERIRYGEETPRTLEFRRSREMLAQSLRRLDETLQTESIQATEELLTDTEKKESKLFAMLDEIKEKISSEMGFERPISLEVTRGRQMNAYVLRVSKEGGLEKGNDVPLRLFINAGLVDAMAEILSMENKELTVDHLAFVIGHELAHLRQPSYDPDHLPTDADEHQRYEYEADMSSLEAMDLAGYNPRAAMECLEILKRQAGNFREAVGHYLTQTHPLTENRVKDLWQAFNQPDKSFFSLQNQPQPISSEIRPEVDRLMRKELRAIVKEARSLEDWENIFSRLEKDPKATLTDAECLLLEFKKNVDARSALAGAYRALEGDSGLSRAVVHMANYQLKRMREGKARKGDSPLGCLMHYDRQDDGQRQLIKELSLEPEDVLRAEFHPGQRRDVDEEKVMKFTLEHGTGNEIVDQQFFSSIENLFDERNPDAVELWRGALDLSPFVNDAEVVSRARKETVTEMAKTICFGYNASCSYRDEEYDKKMIYLKLLKEAMESQGSSEPDLSPQETSFMPNLGSLQALKQRVQEHLSGYIQQPKPEKISRDYIPPPIPFYERAALLDRPQRVPDESFQPEAGQLGPGWSPMSKAMARYFQLTRKITERTFSDQTMFERFRTKAAVSPETRQFWFQRYYGYYFFDQPENEEIIKKKPEHFRSLSDMVDLLRFVPSTKLSNWEHGSEGYGRGYEYGCILRITLGDDQGLDTPQGIADKLELVRLAAHQPRLRTLQHGGCSAPNDREANRMYQEGSKDCFEMKRDLFTRYLRLGWRLPEPGSKRQPSDSELERRLRDSLVTRAKSQGLPEDFFWTREKQLGTWLKIKAALGEGDAKYEDWKARRSAFNRIFSEEFMRLMADDQEEMEKCRPDTISL